MIHQKIFNELADYSKSIGLSIRKHVFSGEVRTNKGLLVIWAINDHYYYYNHPNDSAIAAKLVYIRDPSLMEKLKQALLNHV